MFQGATFNLSRASPLVAKSDLLLHCNNIGITWQALQRALRHYPHACKRLIHTALNSGHRCGHLLAIKQMQSVWAPYRTVMFLHPDVLLTPAAFVNLTLGMSAEVSPAPFIVTRVGAPRFHHFARLLPPTNFATDFFLFRPPLLTDENKTSWIPLAKCSNGSRPEVAFHNRVVSDLRVPYYLIATRPSYFRGIDDLGLWHVHPGKDGTLRYVEEWLQARRAQEGLQEHNGSRGNSSS